MRSILGLQLIRWKAD